MNLNRLLDRKPPRWTEGMLIHCIKGLQSKKDNKVYNFIYIHSIDKFLHLSSKEDSYLYEIVEIMFIYNNGNFTYDYQDFPTSQFNDYFNQEEIEVLGHVGSQKQVKDMIKNQSYSK